MNVIATSKMTRKHQTTIPKSVRDQLGLGAGDLIAFEVDDGVARLRKATAPDMAYSGALEQTLGEWASEADDEAYRDL